MKICQKVLALLLVVCMLGVMIPTMVWAAEASSEDVALLLGKNYDQTPYGLHADFGGYAEAKRITLKKGTLPAGVDYQYSADGFCLVGTPRIEANVQLVFEIDRYGQTTLYHTVNLTVKAARSTENVTMLMGQNYTANPCWLHADFLDAEVQKITHLSGKLPAGVDYTYSADGWRLVGTPTQETNARLVFEVKRYDGSILYYTVNLAVQAARATENVTLFVGDDYNASPCWLHPDLLGYAEAQSITLKSGTLPAGVSYLNNADGFRFVGKPSKSGTAQLIFEIKRAGGSILYYTVNLTVQAGDAPVIVRQPKPVTVVAGSDVTFTVEAAGEGLHYEWWGVDADMPVKIKKDAKSFTLQNVTTDWSGFSFWCRVYNAAGEVLTQKALLTVKSAYQFPFKDVPFGTWYRKDVENANLLGLINGTSATTYEPLKQLDIASAIKLAACMRVLYEGGDPSTAFPRKAGDAWYQPYVDYAKANNIPYNYPDLKAICTREEFVHIFYAALPAAEYVAINHVADNAIPDYKLSDTFGVEVYAFYRAGILTGTNTAGTFNAKGGISRAEVAAILSRMFDDTARKSITLK